MARPKSKTTTGNINRTISITTRYGVGERCAFCDKEASDSIPMHDLNLEFKKELPRQQQRLITLPICEMHYNRYVIRPQLKANMKIIRRIDRKGNVKKK